MARRKGCTLAQLALAWVHHQGDDVCPIPGTSKIENFNQNIGALSVKLTPEEMVTGMEESRLLGRSPILHHYPHGKPSEENICPFPCKS